ncbi:MAG: hypothetical protein H0X41_08665 [Chitinophagaceae bacterium]|nr:hypothetical protein [Chitinophagaceae bacterium]
MHSVGAKVDVTTGLALMGGTTYDLNSITALTTGDYKSTLVDNTADLGLTDPFNNATPNLTPTAGSPLLAGALFDFGALSNAFFEKVSYKGAFDGTVDWTAQWAVWGK